MDGSDAFLLEFLEQGEDADLSRAGVVNGEEVNGVLGVSMDVELVGDGEGVENVVEEFEAVTAVVDGNELSAEGSYSGAGLGGGRPHIWHAIDADDPSGVGSGVLVAAKRGINVTVDAEVTPVGGGKGDVGVVFFGLLDDTAGDFHVILSGAMEVTT